MAQARAHPKIVCTTKLKPEHVETTDDEFHDLWDCINRSAKTTEFIKVPREAVKNMALDHSEFWRALFPTHYTIQKKRGDKHI